MSSKLQEKCPVCNHTAIELSRKQIGNQILINLQCNHLLFVDVVEDSKLNDYSAITFDGDNNCNHQWGLEKNRTTCLKCNAHKLYDFQVTGASLIEKYNGRFGLFDQQGLGKTIQALAYLKLNSSAIPFLWVTKAGIKYQHCREITRILGDSYFPQVLKKGTDKLFPGFKSYLSSYDLLKKIDLSEITSIGIKCIILDECQAIMNPSALRTQALRTIVKQVDKIIPTSGTPWKNRGPEFFTVLNMLDAKMFHNYQHFINTEVGYYYQGNKLVTGGIAKPKEFKEKTQHILIRREREEVMPELPIISRHKFLVEVPKSARLAYKEEEDKLVQIFNDALLEGTEDSFETQKAMNTILMQMKQIVGIAKIPSTVELAQDFLSETDRKLTIFVHHKECARLIENQLKTYCMENYLPLPLVLSSAMSPEERFTCQEKFNGNKYRLLIASTLASGEGLNLQSCSDCIMHERQWNASNEEQAEGRFIRIGQTSTAVVATYVHGDDTIDTILDGIVENKRIAFQASWDKEVKASFDESAVTKDIILEIVRRRR